MQVYFVHIYCKKKTYKKKLIFPILISVIDEIKPYTVDVSRKWFFNYLKVH